VPFAVYGFLPLNFQAEPAPIHEMLGGFIPRELYFVRNPGPAG